MLCQLSYTRNIKDSIEDIPSIKLFSYNYAATGSTLRQYSGFRRKLRLNMHERLFLLLSVEFE